MVHRLLLVDDAAFELESFKEYLEKRGFVVVTAQSGTEALAKFREAPELYSVVSIDYQMKGMNGALLTDALIAIYPDVSILVFSADTNQETVIQTGRKGARGFVGKREGMDVFLREVRKLCKDFEEKTLTVSHPRTAGEYEKLIASIGMVGCSPGLGHVAEQVLKLRDLGGPVTILGESGTGKELVARALALGRRGPFVAVNCADFALNSDTARSELFGHVRGAFTGAVTDKVGYFEAARGGTIFLDEIYALSMEAQTALLRALQEKVIRRVGGTKDIPIDCRIVAAAKPDLTNDVARGAFKADLFYRIFQTIITIPRLADRPDDIAPLVSLCCKRWSAENREERVFLQSTIPYLERYPWPGNFRELDHVVYTTLTNAKKKTVGPADLPARFLELKARAASGETLPLREYNRRQERKYLMQTLGKARSRRDAAKRLQISIQTMLRLMKKHAIAGDEAVGSDRADERVGGPGNEP